MKAISTLSQTKINTTPSPVGPSNTDKAKQRSSSKIPIPAKVPSQLGSRSPTTKATDRLDNLLIMKAKKNDIISF